MVYHLDHVQLLRRRDFNRAWRVCKVAHFQSTSVRRPVGRLLFERRVFSNAIAACCPDVILLRGVPRVDHHGGGNPVANGRVVFVRAHGFQSLYVNIPPRWGVLSFEREGPRDPVVWATNPVGRALLPHRLVGLGMELVGQAVFAGRWLLGLFVDRLVRCLEAGPVNRPCWCQRHFFRIALYVDDEGPRRRLVGRVGEYPNAVSHEVVHFCLS